MMGFVEWSVPDKHKRPVTHYGTLLSVAYVPAQWGTRLVFRSEPTTVKLCDAKWVALVATADGIREMDPLTLKTCSHHP